METAIPSAAPIGQLRRSPHFLRGVAAVVTVAFTMLILTPTVVVAQNEIDNQQQAAALTASDEAELAQTLQKIEERLARFAEKLDRQLDAVEDEQDLDRLRRKVKALDVKVQAKFDRIAERLQEKNLPQVILDRHEAMVEAYRSELARLLENLDAVELAPDVGMRKEKLDRAREHLRGKKHKRAQQPFDPNNLPNKSRKADPNNKPKRKKAEFQSAGLKPMRELPEDALATAMKFELADGYEYWIGLHNFYVITRYNHSSMYAMSVYQLGQRLADRVAE